MKRLISTILLSVLVIMIQAQSYDSPVEYLDYFSNEYAKIAQESWDYTSAIARGKKPSKIEVKRNELIQAMKLAEIRIRKVKDYEGDVALRDKVLEYLSLAYIVLKEDYDKILDMEEIAEQSYDLMEAYMLAQDEADEKMEAAQKLVVDEEKRFAADHNITLTEDDGELQKKLEEASKVFGYYNQIYLVFFKSFKNDAYLSEAIAKMDIVALEQNVENAKIIAEEGTEKLRTYGSFKGDASVQLACRKLLDYYKKDAEVNPTSAYILLQEKYKAQSKIMESKKKSDITQKDVDDFNALVNELNSMTEKYNKYNQDSFKEKSGLIENWNKAVQSFLDKHTPK